VGKAPHLVGKAPHLVGKAPHLVGKKRQKPSDGDKVLPMAPKAGLTVRKLLTAPKAHLGTARHLVSRVIYLTQSSLIMLKFSIVLIWKMELSLNMAKGCQKSETGSKHIPTHKIRSIHF